MRTQQDRTYRGYNLDICDAQDCDEWGWPIVMPTWSVPDRLMTFCIGDRDKDGFAHFFIDDYRFERLWNRPDRYLEALRAYKGVLAPDFSTYTDMPYPMQEWNHYRTMALTSYWQRNGIDVIPVLQWSDEASYRFCFEGLPHGGTVAASTVGVARNREARELFRSGLVAAISYLRPDNLLLYGSEVDLHGYNVPCNVVRYENDNTRRVQRWEEEGQAAAEEAQQTNLQAAAVT